MNQEIMKQWVKDLRDPNRRQGIGYLRNADGGQCCLDVLIEQAVKAGVIKPPVLHEDLGVYAYHWGVPTHWSPEGIHEETQLLPRPVIVWAGLDDENPTINFVNPRFIPDEENPEASYDSEENSKIVTDTISELNDAYQFTLSEIADIIEQVYAS